MLIVAMLVKGQPGIADIKFKLTFLDRLAKAIIDKMKIDWHKFFILASLSFLFGSAIGSKTGTDWTIGAWLGLIWLTLISVATLFRVKKKVIYFGLIFGFGLLGGFLRVGVLPDHSREFDAYLNKKIEFKAEVVSEPDERETLTRLVVRPLDGRAKILLTLERYPEYRPDDIISIRGKIAKPENVTTVDRPQFDYVAYLAKEGIFYDMYKPDVLVMERPEIGGVKGIMFGLKEKLLNVMSRILPEPESSLLAGILLGAKRGLGSELTENFRLAGVSHIVVLSGFNITLVADALLRASFFLPLAFRGTAGALGIVGFGILAGGGSVVWRAVLMALVALYARLSGRIFDVAAAIMFSAVALVAYNPSTLTTDLGFQLSIMALVGIVYVAPWLEQKLFYRVSRKYFRDLLSTTFGAQISVLPLLWYATGQISVIGFLSNLVILPLVPSAMVFGAIASAIGLVSVTMAWPVTLITFILLKLIIFFGRWFAGWPGAGFSLPPSLWVLLIIYGLLAWPVAQFWFQKLKPGSPIDG